MAIQMEYGDSPAIKVGGPDDGGILPVPTASLATGVRVGEYTLIHGLHKRTFLDPTRVKTWLAVHDSALKLYEEAA